MPSSGKHPAKSGLGRLLKKATVLELLGQGRASLRQGAELAVVADGQLLAATAELFPCPQPDDLRFPLGNGAHLAGELLIRPGQNGNAPPRQEMEAIGNLLATALQRILESETVRRAVVADALEQYRESALVRNCTELFNCSLRLDDVSRALLDQCRAILPQATDGVVFGRQQHNGWTPLSFFETSDGKELANIVNSRLFGDIISHGKEEIINELRNDLRWAGEVVGLESLICLPLRSPGHWTGALVLASCQRETSFNSLDLKLVSPLAAVAATAMANAHHFEEVQAMQEALLQALATAIDSRDPSTAGHSQRVASYAVETAKLVSNDGQFFPELTFSSDGLQELFYAGMLHDVGKIGIRESVLTKSTRLAPGQIEIIGQRLALWGTLLEREWLADLQRLEAINRANVISNEEIALVERLANERVVIGDQSHPLLDDEERQRLLIPRGNLTPDEWQEIRNHPAESFRILQHIPFPDTLERVLTIIRQHHEKLDGTGYPDAIGDGDLLLQSRILAIVDIYDALTAKDRPYKRALPREKALAILWEEAKQGKLDQQLLAIFSAHIETIEAETHCSLRQQAPDPE